MVSQRRVKKVGVEYYLVCEDCKKKTFTCKNYITHDRLHADNIASFFEGHIGHKLYFIDDNTLSNLELPMPLPGEDIDSDKYKSRCVYYESVGEA